MILGLFLIISWELSGSAVSPYNYNSQEHFPCCHRICHRLLLWPLYGHGAGNCSPADCRGMGEDCSNMRQSSSAEHCSAEPLNTRVKLKHSLTGIFLPVHGNHSWTPTCFFPALACIMNSLVKGKMFFPLYTADKCRALNTTQIQMLNVGDNLWIYCSPAQPLRAEPRWLKPVTHPREKGVHFFVIVPLHELYRFKMSAFRVMSSTETFQCAISPLQIQFGSCEPGSLYSAEYS